MQVDAMRELIEQWALNGNAAIADITRDLAKLDSLPDGYASPDMLHLVPGTAPDPDSDGASLPSGGPSLQHSNRDLRDAVAMSSTVSLGASSAADSNPYLANAAALSSPVIVQASSTYHDRKTPRDIERQFPDIFVHGRGGFKEPRRKAISEAALLQHWCRLGTRQFQQPDFLFPTTDRLLASSVARVAFVKGNLPSHVAGPSGPLSKAEVYDVFQRKR